MNSLLTYPVLSVSPDNISLSSRQKYHTLHVINIGKNALEGEISTDCDFIKLSETSFTLMEGEALDVGVQVVAGSNKLPKTLTSKTLNIASNGGLRVIPVVYRPVRKSIIPLFLLIISVIAGFFLAYHLVFPVRPEIRGYSSTKAAPVLFKKPSETPVPYPTETKRPTWTPTPTVAPNPILAFHFSNVEITKYNAGNSRSFDWNYSQEDKKVVFKGDNIIIEGVHYWGSGMQGKNKLSPGEGFLIDYKYSSGAEFEIYMDYGVWDTKTYRRFGFYPAGTVHANYWIGTNLSGGALNMHSKPDVWYSVFMAVSEDNEFYAMIWEKENPSNNLIYEKTPDSSWANKSWEIAIGANSGTIYLRDYTEFSFSAIR